LNTEFRIGNRTIGPGHPVFIVSEMSANHKNDLERAKEIIRQSKASGADAIKLQTYTADTITMDSHQEWFQVKTTAWKGRSLYDLYHEASTPWEWHAELKQLAEDEGLIFFSTPFDSSAVDFLEQLNTPVYKIASFELVDTPLIERVAKTGKPIIMSIGMASEEEIREALVCARSNGAGTIALLKCTSNYPAKAEDMNLKVVADLAKRFDVIPGISDHTPDNTVPIAAVALGACIIEKHFTLDREDGALDSFFSLNPDQFRSMVEAVRLTELALGKTQYQPTTSEQGSIAFRKSLFAITDIAQGAIIDSTNIKCIRPGIGAAPKHYHELMGKRTKVVIERGTPINLNMFEENS
jgi:pseudaminic acid synthase